jgi:hypothetical protein
MKPKFLIIALLLVTLFVASVNAPWATLNSGYAIWTNYHGIDIPGGTEVTATAGTTEHPDSSAHNKLPNVTAVRFRWMPPEGPDLYSPDLSDPPKPLTWDGTTYFNEWPVYTANDTQALDVFGDWGVQAWFYDSEGKLRNETGIEKIRAVSVNVIPEIPVVGTAGAAAVMLLVLGLFWHIKKKRPINNSFLPT